MRIEKGFRAWGTDLSPGYTLPEVGAGRFLRDPGPDPARRLLPLTLEDIGIDALPMSPVWRGDARVGEVTSAAYGHRIGAPVALAMLSAEISPGDPVEVEVFGRRVPARTHPDAPLFDPAHERLRA